MKAILKQLVKVLYMCVESCPFFTIFVPATIASQDYYKKSVQALRNHQLATETIGKPVRIPYINLARKDIKIDHKTAQASRSSFSESQ